MNKYRSLIIKILVSVILFYFIFSKIDKDILLQNFSLLDKRYIPLILLLIIGNYYVSSIRWKALLVHKNSENITVNYLTSLYFIGSFFNNFMPTSVGGDVYKVYALGKKINSKSDSFAATFMERFTGMIALVLISYFGLVKTLDFWLSQLPAYLLTSGFALWMFKFLLFFGFWIGILVLAYLVKMLSNKVKLIEKIVNSFTEYKGKYSVLGWALVTSLIVQIFSILSQYFIFTALGMSVPLAHAFFVLPVINLAGFFVPSLNGLGVQDALYIQFFGLVGVSSELALSASILYHLARLSVSLIGGVLYAFEKDK